MFGTRINGEKLQSDRYQLNKKEVFSESRTAQGNSELKRHCPKRFLDRGWTQMWKGTDGNSVIRRSLLLNVWCTDLGLAGNAEPQAAPQATESESVCKQHFQVMCTHVTM